MPWVTGVHHRTWGLHTGRRTRADNTATRPHGNCWTHHRVSTAARNFRMRPPVGMEYEITLRRLTTVIIILALNLMRSSFT